MAENNTRQQVKEITDKLEAGMSELFTSDKYEAYLKTMSRFHKYSTRNTLLIHMQKPDASLVAGYQAWQSKFGRHVNKGEKAIKILAPSPYLLKQEDDLWLPPTRLCNYQRSAGTRSRRRRRLKRMAHFAPSAGDWGTPQQASEAILPVRQNPRNGASGLPLALLANYVSLGSAMNFRLEALRIRMNSRQ